VAKDLGLELAALRDGGVRIMQEGRVQYFALNLKNGNLYVSERVDREKICGRIPKCLLALELFVQEQV
ncbi:PCDG3 protein, partial [Casuarius casuarius]|nr:PCDG3 protein [Casuarius casuarius]